MCIGIYSRSQVSIQRTIGPLVYVQYKYDFHSLGSSSMFKILIDSSALVRKSIEGLDYYMAEGGRAFSDVEEIVDQLNITEEKNKSLKTKLVPR